MRLLELSGSIVRVKSRFRLRHVCSLKLEQSKVTMHVLGANVVRALGAEQLEAGDEVIVIDAWTCVVEVKTPVPFGPARKNRYQGLLHVRPAEHHDRETVGDVVRRPDPPVAGVGLPDQIDLLCEPLDSDQECSSLLVQEMGFSFYVVLMGTVVMEIVDV